MYQNTDRHRIPMQTTRSFRSAAARMMLAILVTGLCLVAPAPRPGPAIAASATDGPARGLTVAGMAGSDFLGGTEAGTRTTHVDVRKFEGTRSGRDVLLRWTTVREVANKGFEVQRASSLSRGWETVAFVPGTGSSSVDLDYQHRDRDAPPEDLRYMLRSVGTDGLIQYSQIISVPVSGILRSFDFSAQGGILSVMHATIELTREEMVSLHLADARGNVIERLAERAPLSSGRYEFPVDVSRLPEGSYELYLYTSEGRYRRSYEHRK